MDIAETHEFAASQVGHQCEEILLGQNQVQQRYLEFYSGHSHWA